MASNEKMLDVIQGISQAVANSHDGALDKDGEPIQIGLNRDVEKASDFVNNSRVMDGFKVYIQADKLCISYHSEIALKDVHDKQFENDIEQTIRNIAKYIKKEYETVTGKKLSITPIKDKPTDIEVQSASRIRSWVTAKKWYKIGGISADQLDDVDKQYVTSKEVMKSWLDNVKNPKKPENVSIAKNANQKKD